MLIEKKVINSKRIGFLLAFLLVIVCLALGGCQGEQGDPGTTAITIVPDDFSSIQQAIDSLSSIGGTIYIKAGTYSLSQGIHINQSNITISGEQGTLIKLDGSVNQPVFLIGTDEETPTARIENIQIANIEIDGNKDFQGSEIDPVRPWIRNNGIDVRMVDDLWIDNVDIHDARSGGIVVSWESSRIFIDNSLFHHNFFDGIALYDSEDIQVSNFLSYENTSAGLSLDNKLKHTSFNNGSIKNNGDVGIFVRDSEDLNFHALMVYGNGSHGGFLSHQTPGTNTGVIRLFFSSCSFLNNNGYGLWLASTTADSPNNTIVGSLFSGNTSGCINIDAGGSLDQDANICQ